jgi:uncharacterized Zn finger protein (UPF0148 family)
MTNEDEVPAPHAGDECPVCCYSPVYEDAGEIICVGCDSHWTLTKEEESE